MRKKASSERLIVALDVDGYGAAAALIEKLCDSVAWFKVGSVLFTREGVRVCRLVKEAGARLFLDLKFHDIPNTVSGAVSAAIETGADMLTLHVSGGEAMMRAAVAARAEARNDVVLVGVTVLTHLTSEDLGALYATQRSAEETVLALAGAAQRAGLNGVVASARELPLLRREFGRDFTVVTPGIRMADSAVDDQARIVTPRRAIVDGADLIVVGRPIIAARDPLDACNRILDDMDS